MISSILSTLLPVIGVALAALTAFLTKYLTNESKAASTHLANAPAVVKQVVALFFSTAIAIVTGLAGLHLGSDGILAHVAVILQALIGWVGSMNLYDSSVKAAIVKIEDLVHGIAIQPAAQPLTINIHQAPALQPTTGAPTPLSTNTTAIAASALVSALAQIRPAPQHMSAVTGV
jgi:hypothetical protein